MERAGAQHLRPQRDLSQGGGGAVHGCRRAQRLPARARAAIARSSARGRDRARRERGTTATQVLNPNHCENARTALLFFLEAHCTETRDDGTRLMRVRQSEAGPDSGSTTTLISAWQARGRYKRRRDRPGPCGPRRRSRSACTRCGGVRAMRARARCGAAADWRRRLPEIVFRAAGCESLCGEVREGSLRAKAIDHGHGGGSSHGDVQVDDRCLNPAASSLTCAAKTYAVRARCASCRRAAALPATADRRRGLHRRTATASASARCGRSRYARRPGLSGAVATTSYARPRCGVLDAQLTFAITARLRDRRHR